MNKLTQKMDIILIRTFLTVAETGSFVGAAARLLVTPSAVSLRVNRLEQEVGRPLFERSKAGAEMTAAGRELEAYAASIVKLWEEARQQVSLPDGYTESLVIGAQYSLWSRLGFGWIDRLRSAAPTLGIRAELGMADRLTRFLLEGIIQMSLSYTPQMRPRLTVEPLTEETLVMVAAWPNPELNDLKGRYVFIDWGPDFVSQHTMSLPEITNPGLTLSLGAAAEGYILSRGMAGYLPAEHAKPFLDSGQLHLVPNAPRFSYPVWVSWRSDLSPTLLSTAMTELRSVVEQETQNQKDVVGLLGSLQT